MSSHPVCKIPFEPNPENYKSDAEHDANARKHWYLVLGVGLFNQKMQTPVRTPHDVLISSRKATQCGDGSSTAVATTRRTPTRIPAQTTERTTKGLMLSLPPAAASSRMPLQVRAAPVQWRVQRVQSPGATSARRLGTTSRVTKPTNGRRASLANDAGVSSAAKRRREGSASVVPSVKGEHQSSVKREAPASPVKHERQPSVKARASAAESESPLSDVLPPLLYGVEADDVLMPHASPVAISATLSTTSSLSSDSSGSGEWISSTSLAAPGITVPGPSRLSALGAGAPAASSAFVGLGESISDARPAAARMGATGPSRISALGAGARDASTSARSVRLLLNSVTRKLYPDPIQALAEVMPGESLQVVAQEEVVEYCAGQSARLGT
ncbi:hypothetical protein B0H14DRAFT_3489932 [Mycena olivaceomarginata]|nr:hypothetical protein B0H14DRAFT_3489932 [Mycena olivaceomarginata]